MKLLAVDLAWDGPSGWVLWESGYADPIRAYGEFKPKVSSKETGANRDLALCEGIFHAVDGLIRSHKPETLAYEYTDWHQKLSGKQNWNQIYARERNVQNALGMAKASLLLAITNTRIEYICLGDDWGVKPVAIGARECKQEFVGSSVLSKENVAWTFKDTYNQEFVERFTHVEDSKKDVYIYDGPKDKPISHHISDAFVIAYVIARREHQRKLVDGAKTS